MEEILKGQAVPREGGQMNVVHDPLRIGHGAPLLPLKLDQEPEQLVGRQVGRPAGVPLEGAPQVGRRLHLPDFELPVEAPEHLLPPTPVGADIPAAPATYCPYPPSPHPHTHTPIGIGSIEPNWESDLNLDQRVTRPLRHSRLLLFYALGLFGILDHNHGIRVANAGFVYFNNYLLAMSKDDIPHHLKITPFGELKTVGRYNFYEQLNSTMIAHLKLDQFPRPYLKYFKFLPEKVKSDEVEISRVEPTMMHDFAITKKYVVQS
ncbi:hypothetical protein RJ640_023307 [Escallonia rubra]|uniref:9-cis-epoxycarotenoid dioxygenase n=1 Tax=Escallonia rubra TaxID=112253 RepID=A0AA88RKW6_9ASTE|nr:hypothetical protein RJ640_023307 [Escallonia rubra]